MTTDVRTLLHEAAELPDRAPDLDRARRSGKSRRRRQRGIRALVAVVALALVTGIVAVGGGGDEARVALAPRQTGSEVPDGWKTIHAEPALTMALPPGWDHYDFGHTDVAATRFAVGTVATPDDGVLNACTSSGQLPTQPGTWLNVWEYSDATASEIETPEGDIAGGFGDRPADFGPELFVVGSCDHVGSATEGDLGAAFGMFAFRDAGRLFYVRVVEAYPVGGSADFTTAARILDTLRVEPLDDTTTVTNTLPATTTSPEAPATTAAPYVPSTADEQEIQDLFVAWLRNHPDDETRAIVEDGDALLDVIHEGLAQHSPEDLTKYSGTVQGIRMLDADHAEVEYVLLFAGQPQFGVRTGVAVRIDGHWRVSRATECSLLSLGGLTCPPQS